MNELFLQTFGLQNSIQFKLKITGYVGPVRTTIKTSNYICSVEPQYCILLESV
jgi:hypothetical protein